MKSRLLVALATICLYCFALSITTSASDWPQWRGPDRNGISTETGLLKQWPAVGPKLLLQVNDLGDGYSTPAVVGNRIYLVSNHGLDNEFVQALSTKDGKVVSYPVIANRRLYIRDLGTLWVYDIKG